MIIIDSCVLLVKCHQCLILIILVLKCSKIKKKYHKTVCWMFYTTKWKLQMSINDKTENSLISWIAFNKITQYNL